MKRIVRAIAFLALFNAACATSTTPPAAITATPARPPTIISPTGYRPLQAGDVVEGAAIDYQYLLPSLERPVAAIAFGQTMLQLVQIKPELSEGFAAYFRDLSSDAKSIHAYDENDPNQKEPKLLTWDASKPIEVAFIPILEGAHSWSVTEGDGSELYAAYKLIRRKDGGLRFVDAYGLVALNSANNTFTLNGGGLGLVLSARLALLRMILSNPNYQRGENVMAAFPPNLNQYDSRILKLDPSQTGLMQNRDWVLLSRRGPGGGLAAP